MLVTVEAGEDWDALVAATVEQGLGGLECLSGIPGSTGATPVQNVGAYGVEVADVLVDVDLYDRRAGEVRAHVPAADLGLGYRASVLKHRDDAVVLRVRFRLRPDGTSAPIRYPELARALGVAPGATVAAPRGPRWRCSTCAAARAWSSTPTTTTPGASGRSSPTRCCPPRTCRTSRTCRAGPPGRTG